MARSAARLALLSMLLLAPAGRARPEGTGPCGLGTLAPDAESAACLSCHDGSRGPSARGGHRYDVPYRAGPFGSGALLPVAEVEKRLRLPGGQVTCTTCHDGSSTLRYHLARPMTGEPRRERLCNVCHDMGA